MAKPQAEEVIIACPQCGTRYRLDRATVNAGRVVQCANCPAAWQAAAPEPNGDDDDGLFTETEERALDETFAVEQAAAAAEAGVANSAMPAVVPPDAPAEPEVDPVLARKRLRAYSRREDTVRRNLPMGRLRRNMRLTALAALVAIAGLGIVFRTEIVRQVPDLAGPYAALGMPVNVVGLEFSDVHTERLLADGIETLLVRAQIIAERGASVPPVVVTLLDTDGAAVYEWQVVPTVRDLAAGETLAFETRLTQPPPAAARARLNFAGARGAAETRVEPANDMEPAH